MPSPVLRTRSSVLALAAAALALGSPLAAADKPVPVAEAAGRMTAPEGFRVTLFAGEPAVVQPIAFTFDDRGRMWVVECLSYPKWRADGKGNDRVTILEDTDGDGTHDKRTVFLDTGSNLSGIELGFGGVWLCSTPNLIFVPDRDGDDKLDGPPEVVLDGWNLKDAKHNVFNGLAWGPDGWLYGCNGIQTKSLVGRPGAPEKDRTYLDCGVWRYHPTRKAFEVVATGTTNPWGVDWDDHGEMFITNCVIDHLWHVVPGGRYTRMYGQDPNPYTFALMGPASDHKHWAGGHWTDSRADKATGAVRKDHSDAGGGHAHSGCAVYLGDNFPPEYRNSVFTCNIHGNRLNRDSLHRTKTGYVGKHEKDFLFANDPWFRGICVKQGPDGGLYVSDWTDTGECHNYDVADTTNGRIYRVTFGSPPPFRGDVAKMSDEELVGLQRSKNEWLVRKARRVLQERAAAGTVAADTADRLRGLLRTEIEPTGLLRAAWALAAAGQVRREDVWRLWGFNNPDVRVCALRLAAERANVVELLDDMTRFVDKPLERPVLLQLAGMLPRVRGENVGARSALLKNIPAPGDGDLSLMVWYALAPGGGFNANYPSILAPRNPMLGEFAVRRLLAGDATDSSALSGLCHTMAHLPSNAAVAAVLRGVRDSLAGRKMAFPPEGWGVLYQKLRTSPSAEVRLLADTVGVQFSHKVAIDGLRQRLTDAGAAADERARAISVLTSQQVPGVAGELRGLLADSAVRGAAVRALAAYPDADTPDAILTAYPSLTVAEKADAVQTLASRPAFASALLDAIEAGNVPKADVSVFAARQIQSLKDAKVSDRLTKVWGTIRPASQTRVEQSKRLKDLLTADRLHAADLTAGRGLFAKHCAACHKLFGEGGDVGPELTGSQRANLDYVLEHVLDPSAVVPGEFRMTAFTLADGRVVTGVVKKEAPQAVTVRTVNDELTIPVADIDARKPTALSIMPDGLFDAMKDDELRDLVAYLASPKQVPVPTDAKRE